MFQDGNARTTDSALHAHRRPLFRNPPSTATSKAGSTRRVQCPRTPAHRAVLAPSTTYRPNAPSPPRPASGTPPGIPPRRPISGQAPSVARREPASTRRVQRPREPARYAPSEGGQEDAPPRSERRPPRKREAACNLTGGQRTGNRVVFHEPALTAAGCPREGNPEHAKTFRPAGTRRASTASNSPCGTEKYASRYRQPESGRGSDNLPPLLNHVESGRRDRDETGYQRDPR